MSFRYHEKVNNISQTHLNISGRDWIWYQFPMLVISSITTLLVKLFDEKMAKWYADNRGMKRKVKVIEYNMN